MELELKTEMIEKVIAGKYYIQEYIGSGKFGAVFLAEHKMLGIFVRHVAIKITKDPIITQEKAQESFKDAIYLARALEESKDSEGKRFLVKVYDMGILEELEGRGYIVMEFISSKATLADHIRSRGKFFISKTFDKGLGEALGIVEQICKGLRVLHSLKDPVIHRDLKPDNILLTNTNEVRIVDFGLAVRLSEVLGTTDRTLGVIDYIAPEILRYGIKGSTPASDVYSVGLIFYKMFTGKHPFEHIQDPPDASEEAKLKYHYETRKELFIEPPSRLNNTVDDRIEAIIMKCLAFDPEKRYQSANELLEALEELKEKPRERETSIKNGKKHLKREPIPDIFWKEKRLRKAEESLLKVISKDVEKKDELTLEAYWGLGKVYIALNEMNKENIDKAILYLEEAKKLDEKRGFLQRENRANLYGDLATAYRKKGVIPLWEMYKREYEKLTGTSFDNYSFEPSKVIL